MTHYAEFLGESILTWIKLGISTRAEIELRVREFTGWKQDRAERMVGVVLRSLQRNGAIELHPVHGWRIGK